MLRLFTETIGAYLTARMSDMPEKPAISFALPGLIPGKNALSVFLYAMTEDPQLRSNEKQYERAGDAWISSQPPLRLKCTYIVSAWPDTADQNEAALIQQDILSAAYRVLIPTAALPTAYLPTPLKAPGLPRPVIALNESESPGSPEFWTAIGSPFRPSFSFTATVSLPLIGESYDHVVEGLQIDYRINNT